MDDALALDHDLDFFRGQAEQPDGLDELQTLVHQGSGVNGDLGAHVPVGVLEGIGLGLAPQLLGLHPEERAAGSREQNLGQTLGALFILQALEDGRVLTVHGQQLDAVLCHRLSDQMAARDKALFVGQCQIVAALNGGQAGTQTRDTHHAVQHHIGAVHGGQLFQALGAHQQLGRVGTSGEGRVQFGGSLRVGHADVLGVKFLHLFENFIHVAVGREAKHLIALCTDDIQTLGADGTGGAQKRNFFRHKKLPPMVTDRRPP